MGANLAEFPELWILEALDVRSMRRDGSPGPLWENAIFSAFAALAEELSMNIAVTYLEAHLPKPRNSVSIINGKGEVVLNYSKVFICDFGQAELLKPSPNIQEIGCDRNCSPGVSFNICVLTGAEVELSVGAMICADREFPEPATQLMLHGAELIVVPNACTCDQIRSAGLKTRAFDNMVGVDMANYPGPGPRQFPSLHLRCLAGWQAPGYRHRQGRGGRTNTRRAF